MPMPPGETGSVAASYETEARVANTATCFGRVGAMQYSATAGSTSEVL